MLRKVRIQNFKSLKDVTLELQKVNLLIGPNNSGKSNFLKGLEFVNERIRNYHNDDVTKFSFKSLKEYPIIIDLFIKLNMYQENEYYRFQYSHDFVKPEGRGGKIHTDLVNEPKSLGNIHFPLNSEFVFNNVKKGDSTEWDFIRENINSMLYKINPHNLTNPYPLLPNNHTIKNDASNLIAFLDSMKDEYPEVILAINNNLNQCIPEFSDTRLLNVLINDDDDLRKIYGDKTFKKLGIFDKIQKHIYWADEVSEGVLYFLALLCIIHQPNPPKLLLLEEPEKGIHPRRIREVIDFIFQLVEEKDIQVIMTTHSERVLDEFEDIPESVFVFDKDEEGATQVKNLLKDIIEPSNIEMDAKGLPRLKFTESLGSHWVTGFIGGVPR